jgi:4-aminobutyrate aminotransferase-like enzyme
MAHSLPLPVTAETVFNDESSSSNNVVQSFPKNAVQGGSMSSKTTNVSLAAIIVEPVQGEGGFIVPPMEYFRKLKAICEENQVLFIADEIQTGTGRTGTMFAMEQFKKEHEIVGDVRNY